MILRDYTPSDCKTLAELFFHTVHIINAKDYSEEQLNAWATGHIDLEQWNCSFLSHYTVVAEIDGTVVGFGDIDNTGIWTDYLFTPIFSIRVLRPPYATNWSRHATLKKLSLTLLLPPKDFLKSEDIKS